MRAYLILFLCLIVLLAVTATATAQCPNCQNCPYRDACPMGYYATPDVVVSETVEMVPVAEAIPAGRVIRQSERVYNGPTTVIYGPAYVVRGHRFPILGAPFRAVARIHQHRVATGKIVFFHRRW